ncbi:hypothetical protein BH18ACI4_BH18ACI4_02370 [soil metagenome]
MNNFSAKSWLKATLDNIPGLSSLLQSVRQREKRFTWNLLSGSQAEHWAAVKGASENGGPRVLIATSLGGYPIGASIESALAVALTLRGARVHVLLCDALLPACQMTKIQNVAPDELIKQYPQPRCPSCVASGKSIFEPLGLPIHWFGKLVGPDEVQGARRVAKTTPTDQIGAFTMSGLAVGEHALAGALRYYARGTLEGEAAGELMLRRYLEAAILSVHAIKRLLQENTYDVACFHHGIYVPQGLIGEVCRQQGVRVVNWNPAYRKHCFIFSHSDSYHHTMISEPTQDWENITWTPELQGKTLDYLKSRWQGTQDWIWFHEKPQENVDQIATELGVDFSRPCIGMLTNVMWDAQLHYRSNAFPDMQSWVLETINYFAKRPELQLIIRVHPAEIRGMIPSRQPLVAEIQRAFSLLPPNVFVIPPESHVSTYAVMERCNAVIIYNTKTGIEISSVGIPVIVAGEAWIRNKGFSLDATSSDEYFRILDELPMSSGLSEHELERAQKYAFHFFFRRMIPLPFVQSVEDSTPVLDLSSLEELLPGRFPGLDVICDGILHGAPFIHAAEKLN